MERNSNHEQGQNVTMSSSVEQTKSTSTFSLRLLFQVVTVSAVFLGLFRLMPELAVGVGLVLSPAIVRTAWIAEQKRRQGIEFTLRLRLHALLTSLMIVVVALIAGLLAFAGVSMLFGLMALLFGTTTGFHDLGFDTAVIGTIGGMVWGMAASMIAATAVFVFYWKMNAE